MSNPYQSPTTPLHQRFANPHWYRLLNYSPWFVVALIVGTHFVPKQFDDFAQRVLFGFFICSLILWIPFTIVLRKAKLYVPLSLRMLQKKDRIYRQAITSFQQGQLLLYDDAVFVLREKNEVVCELVADFIGRDDIAAIELAHRGESSFNSLVSQSPEFTTSISGRTLRVSMLSDVSKKARELCSYSDGQLQWYA